MLCKECAQNVVSNNKTTRNSSFVLADKLQCKWRESNGTEQSWLSWVRIAREAMTSVGEECLRKSHVHTANKPCCSWCGPFLSLEIYISHPKQSFNLFRNISNAFLRSHEASCHLSLLSLTAHCVDYSDWLFARIEKKATCNILEL